MKTAYVELNRAKKRNYPITGDQSTAPWPPEYPTEWLGLFSVDFSSQIVIAGRTNCLQHGNKFRLNNV